LKSRRDFLGLTAGAMGVWAVGASAWVMIDSMNPAADTIASSNVYFDLKGIQPGQRVMKAFFIIGYVSPVFIYRRPDAELKEIRAEDWRGLRDPQSDEERVKKGHDEWLVVIGICPVRGCIPMGTKSGQPRGRWGGWFCPCCGAHYDRSGRARSFPALKNLEVPDYKFETDTLIRMYRR